MIKKVNRNKNNKQKICAINNEKRKQIPYFEKENDNNGVSALFSTKDKPKNQQHPHKS